MLLLLLVLWPIRVGHAADLEIVGVEHIGVAKAQEVAGPVPEDGLLGWCSGVLSDLLALYHQDGYTAARGWFHVDDAGAHIEIDEGHIDRTVMRGANLVENLLYSESLALANDVVHAPTLDEQLELLVSSKHLLGANWLVVEGDGWVKSKISGMVHERVLIIEIGEEEQIGLGVDVTADPLWGFIFGVSYAVRGLGADDDYLRPYAKLAIPLQEYVFEQDPKLRWVYGTLGLRYRMGTFRNSKLAPDFYAWFNVRQYPRVDADVESMVVVENRAFAGLTYREGKVTQSLGAAFQYADIAAVDYLSTTTDDPLADQRRGVVRFGLLGYSKAEWDNDYLRTDLRSRIEAAYHLGWSTEGVPVMGGTLQGQLVRRAGRRGTMLLRVRAAGVFGSPNLYDQLRLAGTYQRTYFGDVYWVEGVASGEIAWRVHLVSVLDVGVFYDHSIFGDLTDPTTPVLAGSSSFGPSLHLLTFGGIAIDAYLAFGRGPRSYESFSSNGRRWSNTIGLALGTVY